MAENYYLLIELHSGFFISNTSSSTFQEREESSGGKSRDSISGNSEIFGRFYIYFA